MIDKIAGPITHVEINNNLLIGNGVEHRESPHQDERPFSMPVDLLVIHNISLPPQEFGGSFIEELFLAKLNPEAHPYFSQISHLRVSAHLLIRRDGTIVQFVPFNQRAWHAGVSQHEGRDACNDFSIGIELEGTDDIPYTGAQYYSLQVVTQALLRAYPAITKDRIVGHEHIAPGRKTDPGPSFDWKRYLASL